MDVSIIVIGDELLIGQVVDTNSGWIARNLHPLGWHVRSVRVVSDNTDDILLAIEQSFAQTDIVLTTGGLGPTKDDITKSTLCKYFGGELVLDKKTLENVQDVVRERHLSMNSLNEAQALVPTSCRVIQNKVGTAPIMWFDRDGKVLVAMPGVPFETETMMKLEVIPQLISHFSANEVIEHRTFVVIGYAESALAIKLEQFENDLPQYIHLAYLPKPGIIRLRLSGISHDAQRIKADMDKLSHKLDEILGDSIIAHEDKTVASILGDILREKGLTMATAESCTGGNIAHLITNVAGSSDYFLGSVVSYANSVKENVLKVSTADLSQYGAVSEPVVIQMVKGVSDLLGADCAISTSGIAGPGGGSETKPVGTVWIASKVGDMIVTQCKHIPGTRERVIERASNEAIIMIIRLLKNL